MGATPLLPRGVRRSGPPRASTRRLFSVLVFLTVACGCIALLAHPGFLAAAPGQHFITAAREPPPLAYPIWWHAPFFSESGGAPLAAAERVAHGRATSHVWQAPAGEAVRAVGAQLHAWRSKNVRSRCRRGMLLRAAACCSTRTACSLVKPCPCLCP